MGEEVEKAGEGLGESGSEDSPLDVMREEEERMYR